MLVDIFIDGKKVTYTVPNRGEIDFRPLNRILVDCYGHIAGCMIFGDNNMYQLEELGELSPKFKERLEIYGEIMCALELQRRKDIAELEQMDKIITQTQNAIKGGGRNA